MKRIASIATIASICLIAAVPNYAQAESASAPSTVSSTIQNIILAVTTYMKQTDKVDARDIRRK